MTFKDNNKIIDISYAFQPIVDINCKKVFSYEALLRGINDEPAINILSKIPKEDILLFDQYARNIAIEWAARLGIECYLNLNFLPDSLQSSEEYIIQTVESFKKNHLSLSQLFIEITEQGIIQDYKKFTTLIDKFRSADIKFAIDDFGAGYSGLNLLVNFQPHVVKLDMQLIRSISTHGPRQAILKAIIEVCISLGIDIIAEGIETLEEYNWLKSQGIYLMQGYFLSKPGFQRLPSVSYPET